MRDSIRCYLDKKVAILAFILIFSITAYAQDPKAIAQQYIPKLEKNLKQNILPFWLTKSLDRKNGGYIINFGPKGEPLGEGTKMIVTQARQVWLFSRAARAGYCGKECLEAADLGYRFLRDKMWDAKNGGFYWEVDASGSKKLRPMKHLYGQSFALYALSEYYLAGGRKDVLDLAIRHFDLLEAKAHDEVHGGYIESFNADWTSPPAGVLSYMGVDPSVKLMNTHLHLLEAITTFYRASKSPLARERLVELIMIESSTVVRKGLTACTDKYQPDWTPILEKNYARVSYGHDIENVWLLMDACDAIGLPHHPFSDLYQALWNYSLKYGWDETNGGFFYTGAFNQPSDDRNKSWWVQSEAIVSALHMYRLTRDPKYLGLFERTYSFIENHQVDWENGEWHDTITPDGKPRGNKAHGWKAGYHNGRAMIECLGILKQFQ
jgi:mannobiose 2-epimerase